MVRKIRRPNSDGHYCVLADLLFSILMATVSMISNRVSISEISVVQQQDTGSSTPESDTVAPVFTIMANGELKIDDAVISIDSARGRLKELDQSDEPKRVVVRVAPECRHQHVASFYKLCHDLNVEITEQILIDSQKDMNHE